MNEAEDREKYPKRYSMSDGGHRYEQPWAKEDEDDDIKTVKEVADNLYRTKAYVPRSDAEAYLNEWHNKGYTGNYIPEALRGEGGSADFVVELDDVKLPMPGRVIGTRKVRVVEERVVDPKTGGEKGRKENELAFVDPEALEALGRVAGKGTRKYDKYNYLRGYDWSLSANALQRHYLAFWKGEDIDPESGEPHMAHAAWHALALVSFVARGIGNDDRPPRGGEDEKEES